MHSFFHCCKFWMPSLPNGRYFPFFQVDYHCCSQSEKRQAAANVGDSWKRNLFILFSMNKEVHCPINSFMSPCISLQVGLHLNSNLYFSDGHPSNDLVTTSVCCWHDAIMIWCCSYPRLTLDLGADLEVCKPIGLRGVNKEKHFKNEVASLLELFFDSV